MKRVAILGLGLIGGSLGMALRNSGADVFVHGFDKAEAARQLALERGAADICFATAVEAVAQADIVILATPVLQMASLMAEIAEKLPAGCVVSDVGSTKSAVSEALEALLPEHCSYIGGHPMAGGERSGMKAAQKNLFQGQWYLLLPGKRASEAQVEMLRTLLLPLGAKVAVMHPQEHDQWAAVISHIPHVTAAALVHLLARAELGDARVQMAGGGFRDTTRIASSDADMWADICISNAAQIHRQIGKLQDILAECAQAVEAGDRQKLHAYFLQARTFRESWLMDLR
ncbi:MAG: prephenate dehydrogenase/arogenate dehydrogenase family protein [Anaeromusa sp.]|uniref:prephenate dehydrogenase n=1 Tax=Anaeromusa sp. TaxID=1872520 RepID=UPI00260A1447|nr:prephenate dehydrogenase/arogenate dehydrogenase family protein [Anaeromusa sp.]MDD3158724.1 prephenate dehydrogenase/arogenate dehydrogenase family protein [Anaeromusa sp.]MEA4834470.1 prephenate dehydrogenase/arogenate dehydrogenase family protein [Anaeromusa sp.]